MSKTVLITGTTSGIGLETVRALARNQMNIIMVARDQVRLEALKSELMATNPDIEVRYYLCDFSDLQATKEIAQSISKAHPNIDILINNAGTWFDKLELNSDGLEMTWVVNYFAVVVFTEHLLTNLKQRAITNPDMRIIIVSSEGHRFGKIDLDNLNTFHFQKTYGSTKLADMLYAFHLARRLKDTTITVNALHPGVIATGLWRKLPKPIAWIMSKVLASPEKGAQTSIYLATVDTLHETGKYWADCKVKEPSIIAQDQNLQEELYQFTMKKMTKYL